MLPRSSLVADGYQRAQAAADRIVREQVWAEYQERWQQASLLNKIRLHWEIESEIIQRVHHIAPPNALY